MVGRRGEGRDVEKRESKANREIHSCFRIKHFSIHVAYTRLKVDTNGKSQNVKY